MRTNVMSLSEIDLTLILSGRFVSYAMLGDIHIAESNALLGFSGPHAIEQTIREKLPAGFQHSEHVVSLILTPLPEPQRVLQFLQSSLHF